MQNERNIRVNEPKWKAVKRNENSRWHPLTLGQGCFYTHRKLENADSLSIMELTTWKDDSGNPLLMLCKASGMPTSMPIICQTWLVILQKEISHPSFWKTQSETTPFHPMVLWNDFSVMFSPVHTVFSSMLTRTCDMRIGSQTTLFLSVSLSFLVPPL